jgi:hypothetical protein
VRKPCYVQVLSTGIIEGVRGSPWAVKSDCGGPLQLLSFATLTRAVYCAHQKEPLNPHVQFTIGQGLKNATVLRSDIPDDVIMYLINLHNSYHFGVDTTIVEILRTVVKLNSQWSSHCTVCLVTNY